ncbi:MAG TPA: PAS domain S-box protein [Bryobacteraceae bacterium]|nr:PAS domain S-box protein [Bryobacteraceae bacterium]
MDELGRIALDSLRERVCVLDELGTIILTNRAWDQFAQANGGGPRQCGIGADYLAVCRAVPGPFAELASEAAAGLELVLRGHLPHFSLDYPWQSPSRKTWFRLTARPLCRTTGILVAHADVTAHAVTAEKLRHVQECYDALSQNPADPFLVVGAPGTIENLVPETRHFFGYGAAELAGRDIRELVHADDAKSVRQLLRECRLKPHATHSALFRWRSRNGSWIVAESEARKLQAGSNGRIAIACRDIGRFERVSKTQGTIRQRDELARLAAHLFQQQEQERRLLVRELRDGLGQKVAALALQANRLASTVPSAPAGSLQDTVLSLEDDLRQLVQALHPPLLDRLGLAVALREYAGTFGRKQGIRIHYTHRGIPTGLAPATASMLYRVAQAALENVAMHARTEQAWITLTRTARGIRLAVRDAGVGFAPSQLAPEAALGIAGMRQRLAAVRGSLSVRSRAGCGTTLVAMVPLAAAGDQPRAAIPCDVVVNPLDQH